MVVSSAYIINFKVWLMVERSLISSTDPRVNFEVNLVYF